MFNNIFKSNERLIWKNVSCGFWKYENLIYTYRINKKAYMLANMQEKACNVGETEWLYIKIVKKSF